MVEAIAQATLQQQETLPAAEETTTNKARDGVSRLIRRRLALRQGDEPSLLLATSRAYPFQIP